VEVRSVEVDRERAALAQEGGWPAHVQVIVGDGELYVRRHPASFDLIFADARGGKWEGLQHTIAALRPGSHLLVDDMRPPVWIDETHRTKVAEVRSRLLGSPELVSVEIGWATGIILCTRSG
jgi:predicted O-methyltransferase YrrM